MSRSRKPATTTEQADQTARFASVALVAAEEALYVTSTDGVIRYWSPGAENLFGYPATEVLGQPAAERLSVPEGVETARAATAQAVASGSSFGELTRRARDGRRLITHATLHRVTDQGEDGTWIAVSERDLAAGLVAETDLRAQLLQAQEGQSMLKTVLDSARDMAIIGADPDGVVTLWSAGAERLFACRAEDICGPGGAALLDTLAGGSESLKSFFRETVERGSFDRDFEARTKGQRPFPANIVARPRLNRFGRPEGVIAIVQDLTQRVETLRQRNEALAEAQRARQAALAAAKAKSDFLANMSHEIRTPMNAVLGMLQLLMRTELNNKQEDYADKAQTAATALLHIIDDILDFSKIEAGKLTLDFEPFSVDKLLRDIAVILGANVGQKLVEILFDVDPNLPQFLEGDAHRLKQILINLAGNALKFTHTGEVVLSVRAARSTGDTELVQFSVRDTGIGMSQEQQQRLFQAFTQAEAGTTKRYGGTGLGLVISRRLVRLMDGEMTLESKLGAGSTFSFTVPLKRAPMQAEVHRHKVPPAELANLRVLVVDDNANAREIIASLARSLGWRVDIAASGPEAIDRVVASTREREAYDIAFVDWGMPDMDGWETVRAMHELAGAEFTPMAVIMVTAHTREALDYQADQDRGLIADFLAKPVTGSDLFDAVANVLAPAGTAGSIRKPSAKRLAGLNILVVEDNPNNQQIAYELLGHEGAQVELANGGQEAIDLISRAPEAYDAILMDVQMPGMDGYTATRKIRAELDLPALPIIAMTANVMPSDREAGFAAGMNDYIGKPYHIEQVVETVLEHCGGERPVDGLAADVAEDPAGGEASSGSEPAVDPLPDSPPGFDFAAALNRLGNNRALYASQARGLAGKAGGAADQVRTSLQRGDVDTARRELHTLRGLAATLGAPALAAQLQCVETALKDQVVGPQLDEQLDHAERLLAQAGQVLSALADELEPPMGGAEDAPRDIGADELVQMFDTLDVLLGQGNMRALDVFAELRPSLAAAHPDRLAEIGRVLDALDFPLARERLRELRSSLE